MQDDFELLDRWRGGEQAAGNQLFERHFDAVCRFFYNKVEGGVEDLIQQTFLACVEARDRFRGESRFFTFLYAVAQNVLRAHYRSLRKDRAGIAFEEVTVHDLNPTPSMVVGQRKEQRVLLQALRRLPLDMQIVLELYYWERLAAPRLAEILDIPEGTARSRLRRAKEQLRIQIQAIADSAEVLESTLGDLEGWANSLREAVSEADSGGSVVPPDQK